MSQYQIMWNLPGCLPEMEPMQFETLTEAKIALCDELEQQLDQAYMADRPDLGRKWYRLILHIEGQVTEAPFNIEAPDGLVYGIEQIQEPA